MRFDRPRLLAFVAVLMLAVLGCGGASTPATSNASAPISSAAAASPAPASPGAASPAASGGTDITGTIESGGQQRTYLLHLPPALTRLRPTPVVLVFHGWPMTAERIAQVTHLAGIADKSGFAVVFPQGYQKSWSVPGGLDTPAKKAGIDDVAFTRALLDAIGPQYQLDSTRAMVTGISNGGHLVQALGCGLADHLVGIVPVAAPLPAAPSDCAPSRPLSVLEIVGSMDQDPATFLTSLAFWAGVDKCPSAAEEEDLPDIAHDGTTVTIATYTGCAAGTEVTGYLINGGGHAWPGGERLGDVDEFGITSKQVDASELIATFLGIHR